MLGLVALVAVTSGCNDPTYITTTTSMTPPKVVMGSASMPYDFSASSDSPHTIIDRRARSDTSALVVAQAADSVSGVRWVRINASADTLCHAILPATSPAIVHQTTDLSKTTNAPSSSNGQVPTQLSASTAVNMPALLACPSGYTWRAVNITLMAQAENYSNLQGQTAQVAIRHEYDYQNVEFVRVGEFNVANDIIGHPPYTPQQETAILQGWGQTLIREADVVLLAEVKGDDQAKTLAQSAGYQYWYAPGFDLGIGGDPTYSNTGVVSRCPIFSSTYHTPEGYSSQDKTADVTVNCPPARGASGNGPITWRFLANHWNSTSGSTRVSIATKTLGLIQGETNPLFVGGDFNAVLGTPEIGILTDVLSDGLTTVQHDPAVTTQVCVPTPIDHVFSSGPYVAYQYKDDCVNNQPSDHAYVVVSYELTFAVPLPSDEQS